MEKKPTKKASKVYKQLPPLIIDSSEKSDGESYEEQPMTPETTKQNQKMIQSITNTEYKGNANNTFTQNLTNDEIKAMLDGYKRVQPYELQKGYNIRYFIKDKDTGDMLFRTGGMITLINDEKQYIIVSGGRTFSVQLHPTTIFFQQMPISEVVRNLTEDFEIKIQSLTQNNKTLQNMIIQKDKQIQTLENTIKKFQNNKK